MKVRLVRDEVIEGLASIQQVVPPKTTLPILSNLLLRAEGQRLHMASTDLDISMKTSVPAEVVEEGTTTAPARKFSEIVKEFPEEIFQMDESEDRITLTCGKGQYKLTGMDWEEFPKLQDNVEGTTIMMDGEHVRRMISGTVFAVSSDETRPALGGVLWKINGKDSMMVSTDGHRLAKLELTGVVGGDGSLQAELIIPPKALNQITRLLGEGRSLDEIVVGEKYVQVKIGESTLLSRLIEGPYPNYEMVVPKDNDKRLVVGRDVLEAAVRRVSILSNTQTHQVKFELDAGAAMLSAVSPDLGGEAREQIDVSYEGDPMAVAYNAAYLLVVLRHISSGEIELTLKTPVSAGLVRPTEQAEGEDLTFLLMPLRLNE
jgi:DNA polymerase-3 subunit beta